MTLEELFVEASESNEQKIFDALAQQLAEKDKLDSGDTPSNIEFLMESWSEDADLSEIKCRFCIQMAQIPIPDSALFRNILNTAIKNLLPPYLAKASYLRALGLRDTKTPLDEVAFRYHALVALKNGVITYHPDTRKWCKVAGIDEFAGAVAISNINGTTSHSVPLTKILSTVKLFEQGPITRRLIEPSRSNPPTAADYRNLLLKRALTPISHLTEDELKGMALSTFVPDIMNQNDFNLWWQDVATEQATSAPTPGKREPCDARSIQELHTLLKQTEKEIHFKEDELAKLNSFFEKITPPAPSALAENRQLAESIAMIALHLNDNEISETLEPLKNKLCFWPENPDISNTDYLEVWEKLPAKTYLPSFVEATALLFSDDYLAKIAAHLPLKPLNAVCASLDDELIAHAVYSAKRCSCDILLWIWKNRAKHPTLLPVLNMDNIVTAISAFELPKAWLNAQRELKKVLIDKAEFQKILIANAEDNPASIVNALQKAKGIQQGEQQSLLVKLSRYSKELKEILSQGVGERMLAASASNDDTTQESSVVQPDITSLSSFEHLKNELDRIVKIDVPENREAIKIAREHGDFRENAEYDAAKERRNFLTNRRGELERDLSNAQPIDFTTVKPEDSVIVGSTVHFTTKNGEESLHLVGAWDGDPDLNCISYKTRMGKCLLGCVAGDSVELPDGTKCTIKGVAALSEALLEKFSVKNDN